MRERNIILIQNHSTQYSKRDWKALGNKVVGFMSFFSLYLDAGIKG